MAKKSVEMREVRREKTRKRYAKKRAALIKTIDDANTSPEARWEARQKLQALPVNASPVRENRRCQCCQRPRSVYRKFKLCRICVREFWGRGEIPGLVKASW